MSISTLMPSQAPRPTEMKMSPVVRIRCKVMIPGLGNMFRVETQSWETREVVAVEYEEIPAGDDIVNLAIY